MSGYLYFIIRSEDAPVPPDTPLHVKIGRTSDPMRRLSTYATHHVGSAPPVYLCLWQVADARLEEMLALRYFKNRRVTKDGGTDPSEVVLITKEDAWRYSPWDPDARLLSQAADARLPPAGRPRSEADGENITMGIFPGSDDDVSGAFDPDMLEPLRPDTKGRVRITWRRIYLAYPCHFNVPLVDTITFLESQVPAGVTLPAISAIKATGPCRLIGQEQTHTHIALEIAWAGEGQFIINGITPFKISGVTPRLRLIRNDHQWTLIYNVYHRRWAALQCLEGGRLSYMPPRIPIGSSGRQRSGSGVTGWAIYCRTAGSFSLEGETLEADIQVELQRQELACIAYAQGAHLAPISGPQNVFTDTCGAEVPPGARSGLEALVASGAQGILCVDMEVLAPPDYAAAASQWLERRGILVRAIF